MTTSMIERVARAICKAQEYDWDDLAYLDPRQDEFVDYAIAAIKEMRDPTEGMIAARFRNLAKGGRAEYEAMIDDALADGSPAFEEGRQLEAANDSFRDLELAASTFGPLHHYTPDNDNLPSVIGLSGAAGSGKSTAAAVLVDHGYTLVKFAGPLKDMMRAIGLSEDHIEGGLKEAPCALLQGKTPRHAMQTIGTQWGRDIIGPHFWIGLWEARVLEVLDSGGRVVTDDCRFENEADAIRKLGGSVVRLMGRGGIAGDHVSEIMDWSPDAVLMNDGERSDLKQSILRMQMPTEVRRAA